MAGARLIVVYRRPTDIESFERLPGKCAAPADWPGSAFG
jgi:hypothetical protein